MARELGRPPPGWAPKSGRATLRAWRSLSPGYRAQVQRAHERGYGASVHAMTRARATGRLSDTDQALRAAQRVPAGRSVTDLGAGRWNFHATMTPGGQRRLQANVERAARLGNRNIAGTVTTDAGQSFSFGGRRGVAADVILGAGDGNALAGILAQLSAVYGGAVELDIMSPDELTVSLFVFPVDVELQ